MVHGTTYMNIIADQDGNSSGLFQQDNAPFHSTTTVQKQFEEMRYQSNQTPVGHAGLIHGSPTSQFHSV